MKDIFHINIPISKIDEEKRIVTGIATTEAIDSQGDIVDYEASKKAFSSWVGNIREMHDATRAIGKGIDIQFDDDSKQVIVSAKISESADGENAWVKVKEGILSGFSIGGKIFKVLKDKTNEGVDRIVDYSLSELSLVDNPANPDAQLIMVKSKDGKLQRVEKAGTAVVDGDPRDASGNTINEVINGSAPKKAGTLVPKKVVGRDGKSTTDKASEVQMKKSVWDAGEAIRIASELTYLIMVENDSGDQDQVNDLVTAFNALRDFAAKEIAEGDDYALEYAEVIEMGQKAINLRKDKDMTDKKVEKSTAVGASEERDENAKVVATAEENGRPENDTEERAVENKVPVDEGEEVTVKTEGDAAPEAADEEATETPEEEATEAEEKAAPAEPEEDKAIDEKKSVDVADLVKNIETLLTKRNGTEITKVADAVKELGAKVEKSVASLEERLTNLEKQPVATKTKASYVVAKGDEVTEESAELKALLKRQDEIIANPESAKPGEMQQLFTDIRKARNSQELKIN